ncbi:aminoglycoside phosphotransferase family protein [bacterium]|nr:MAG: aminoglycoside phosphotransferase family protein [bacterium]
MLEKQSVSDQHIIDCLNNYYGMSVAILTCLPLGADADASVYKAQTHENLAYFVKLKRGQLHHDIGITIQLLLHDAGIQQIISLIKTKQGQISQSLDGYTLFVYPFIAGKDGFAQNLTNNQWITLGKALRQVHDLVLPPSMRAQIKRETYSPKWREVVRSVYLRIETEEFGDSTARQLSAFMKTHQATIQRLVERAERLSFVLKEQSLPFVLCHSDIHAGNVLIGDNGLLYLVDWDAPTLAPKERDLMFIGGGVANVWNNHHEEELFYQGYGKTDINKAALAYYRHERIVEDIADYCQQLLFTTDGGDDRSEMFKQFTDMFEPRGVVEIAFKTDVDV